MAYCSFSYPKNYKYAFRYLLIYSYDNDDMRSSKSHVTLLTLILLLTKRCSLNPRFKKRTRCHSFMAINRASDVSAADWLSQTHVENYRNFSSGVTWFFSVEEEVSTQQSSLYNKTTFICWRRPFIKKLPHFCFTSCYLPIQSTWKKNYYHPGRCRLQIKNKLSEGGWARGKMPHKTLTHFLSVHNLSILEMHK